MLVALSIRSTQLLLLFACREPASVATESHLNAILSDAFGGGGGGPFPVIPWIDTLGHF